MDASIPPSTSSHSSTLESLTADSSSITSLTWNIEGLKRSKYSLKYFVDEVDPDFIFLNETQTFQFEADKALDLLHGEYCHVLNSDDVHDPELSFVKNRSHGGTMILWKRALNQSVSVLPPETSSFIAIIFHPPASQPSIHISLYLPTAGKESEFVEEITKLRIFIENLGETHPDHQIYIRGDSNVNPNNGVRVNIFNDFKSNLKLAMVSMGHKTYHHFLGQGLFD